MPAYLSKMTHGLALIFPVWVILLLCCTMSNAQSSKDCLGAIKICDITSSIVKGTNYGDHFGFGDIQELSDSFYCVGPEINSTWYSFSADRDGPVGFTAHSTLASDAVDYAVWDLTMHQCSDIINGQAPIISCNSITLQDCLGSGNTTGPTGESEFHTQGPECTDSSTNFNALIDAEAGHSYVIMVNNLTSGWGNSVRFRLTHDSMGVYDVQSPVIENTLLPTQCGDQNLQVTFNEPIRCESITSAHFEVLKPDGSNIDLQLSKLSCDANGATQIANIVLDEPIDTIGDFMLQVKVNGDDQRAMTDLCGNQIEPASIEFEVKTDGLNAKLLPDSSFFCPNSGIEISSLIRASSYFWSDGTTTRTAYFDEPGPYTLAIEGVCGSLTDTVMVLSHPEIPAIDLGADTVLCPGETILLDPGEIEQGIEYAWASGWPDRKQPVNKSGEYTLSLSNNCSEVETSIRVNFHEPVEFFLPADTFLCEGEAMVIDPVGVFDITDFSWSDGYMTSQRIIDEPGEYGYQVLSLCDSIEGQITVRPCDTCNIYIPNAITLNEDGVNDTFLPQCECPFIDYELHIFNRWGARVFHSDQPQESWNGLMGGQYVGSSAYLYVLKYSVFENNRNVQKMASGNLYVIF